MLNKVNSKIIVRRYPEEKYYTMFNKETGFFIRSEYDGIDEPFWAKSGPELIDISICNWCDKQCDFCYRNANVSGKFININDFENIIRQASEMGVYQVALGGGNPNQHPHFVELLRITRDKYGIVPSYTTNGRGLTNEILGATKRYCGAVAISMYTPKEEFEENLKKLIKSNIKTNIHFLLTNKSIDDAINILMNPPKYIKDINAMIFLNYKPVGKNSDDSLLLHKNKSIEQFFELISANDIPFKIGFDSCSVSGIVKYMNINSKFIEPCEAGRFSMFISEDMKMYPCSFMIDRMQGIDIKKNSIKEVWNNNKNFVRIRGKIKYNECKDKCESFKYCMGGCPEFNDIKLCK